MEKEKFSKLSETVWESRQKDNGRIGGEEVSVFKTFELDMKCSKTNKNITQNKLIFKP